MMTKFNTTVNNIQAISTYVQIILDEIPQSFLQWVLPKFYL
jgi:hypothetical protein